MDIKKKLEIKNMPISKIGNLTKGFVKIKGKLYNNSPIKSKLKAADCIGYSYNAMKWVYKKKFGKSKRDRWEIIDSQIKCEDFYIFDSTGKVKVLAKNITIFTDLNYHKIKENYTTYTESLLLANQQEYYIMGTVAKYKNNLVISNNDKQELIIASPNEYEIIFNTSKAYYIGCGFFLIILIVIFFWFLLEDLI